MWDGMNVVVERNCASPAKRNSCPNGTNMRIASGKGTHMRISSRSISNNPHPRESRAEKSIADHNPPHSLRTALPARLQPETIPLGTAGVPQPPDEATEPSRRVMLTESRNGTWQAAAASPEAVAALVLGAAAAVACTRAPAGSGRATAEGGACCDTEVRRNGAGRARASRVRAPATAVSHRAAAARAARQTARPIRASRRRATRRSPHSRAPPARRPSRAPTVSSRADRARCRRRVRRCHARCHPACMGSPLSLIHI
eukprot:7378192-Prymnesium_polylepis.1